MGAIDENSVRQQIIRLEIGETATFPVERIDYIESATYRIGKRFGREYSRPVEGDQIKVTRTK